MKLNGFRIELGEVEAAILSRPGIQEAAAVLYHQEGGPGGGGDEEGVKQQLVAYYQPDTVEVGRGEGGLAYWVHGGEEGQNPPQYPQHSQQQDPTGSRRKS